MALSIDLADHVVMVTGGTRGIGRGIAECFLEAGAAVVVCGRKEPETLPNGGQGCVYLPCNVRDPDAVQVMVDAVMARYGRLDVWVNNAGGAPPADAATVSPRFHASIIDLNLTAALHCAQAANRVMQDQAQGGCIVNIASVSGLRPSPGTAAYGAAKAGMLSLTGSLAVEWAPKVRVNAIAAGPVETELSLLHYGDAEGIRAVGETIPMGRMATPRDVGDAAVMLASPSSAYLTGATLLLHGGGEKPAFLGAAKNTES